MSLLQNLKMTDWRKLSHVKGVPIINVENGKFVLLIGQDNIGLILARQIRSVPDHLPLASRCKIRWSKSKQREVFQSPYFAYLWKTCIGWRTYELVRQSYTTETIVLLWRRDDIRLPENKFQTLQRLKCIEKKWLLNEDFAEECCLKIRDYEEKGYVRKLTAKEGEISSARTWCLSHFDVEQPNKSKKLETRVRSSYQIKRYESQWRPAIWSRLTAVPSFDFDNADLDSAAMWKKCFNELLLENRTDVSNDSCGGI